MTAIQLKRELKKFSNKNRAESSLLFFKTGEGQYGYGDKFIGVTVPNVRKAARKFNKLSFIEIEKLLHSKVHEERLAALLILVDQFKLANENNQKQIYDFYLKNISHVNNWDLVDLSAPNIIGQYLENRSKDILYKMAKSNNLWERRISIVSTLAFIVKKQYKDTLKIAEILINDKEDLIHKAVGWMLREVGKRVSKEKLTDYLNIYYKVMPRTMLRYSIEHFDENLRQQYLKGTI